MRARRRVLGTVLVFDAMPAALLAQVLPQQLAGLRIQQPDVTGIPLHLNPPADPAWRCAVVGGFDFHAAIQMHRALAVLVIAERLDRQREQGRLFFGEHGRDLPFGGAVNARVGPTLFPVIQVGLRFFEAFEAQPLQRRFLGVADARFDLALAVWIAHAAWQRDCAVVLQHVAVQRIERGIVDVGREHAFAQIIEHDHASGPAEPAESFFMQFGPDLRTGTEHQQANRLAAVAQRQDEQPRAPILASVRSRAPSGRAVIDLRFFARRGFDTAQASGDAAPAACGRSAGHFDSRR